MVEFEIQSNILDLDGDLVLALEDEANGLWVRGNGLVVQERRWVRQETRSPWVDGAATDGATIDQGEASVLVKVFGATWASVEGRLQALLDATTAREWLYQEVVEGVSKVWRAGPVDVLTPPTSTADLLNKRRFVVLTFPVQPSPVVTGI